MKNILIILFASLLVGSCGTIKTRSLLTQGEVEQEKYKVEIPFEYRLGLIIIKVKIEGVEYDFLVDTGAPNVLSKEVAQVLNLKQVVARKVSDSQGETSKLDFVTINKINIGGINFLNTGAAVADLKLSSNISCLKLDGFIGSNLMKKAIWDIDYENQKITITNSIDSLNIPSDGKKIKFKQQLTGTPWVDIHINGEPVKGITVDLGSNGNFSLSNRSFNKLSAKEIFTSTTFAYGSKSSGLYGMGSIDTTNYAIAPNITLGDISLKNKILEFGGNKARIGNSFFKNYRTIFNWFDQEITMIKTNESNYSKMISYGFSPLYDEDKIFIGNIYKQSPAENVGLKIGDQILEVNGKDYNNVPINCWCEIILNEPLTKGLKQLSITVLREGEKLIFDLKKDCFFGEKEQSLSQN